MDRANWLPLGDLTHSSLAMMGEFKSPLGELLEEWWKIAVGCDLPQKTLMIQRVGNPRNSKEGMES